MKTTIKGFAAWHPLKGFDEHGYEGPVVYANLDNGLISDVKDLNENDSTHNRNGWRVVRVTVTKDEP